jgi:hypothetical protein
VPTQTTSDLQWAFVALKRCGCGACTYDVPTHKWQGDVGTEGTRQVCRACENRLDHNGQSWQQAGSIGGDGTVYTWSCATSNPKN